MNKRWLPVIIILVLALALFLVRQWGRNDEASTKKKVTTRDVDTAPGKVNRNRGFDRRTALLTYSRHAACRMDCRGVSREEVEAIMQSGRINYNKSDLQHARCPRYAVEGNTDDGQRVRIVYAQCDDSTAVVTVIDLGEDHACDCPGDDNKYRNKR